MLAVPLVAQVLSAGNHASAVGSIYVNDSSNVLSGSLGSVYAVGDKGSISVTGGTYAITGNGVELVSGSAVTPTIPNGDADGTTVGVLQNKVRVGLYYYYSSARNTAQPFANLENKAGSGYKFGYYDSARNFIELGNTDVTKLTMVPNVNTAVSGGTVGSYHIKLGAYGDFNSAKFASSQYADGFPAYINGKFYAMIGNYQNASETNSARVSLGVMGEIFTGSPRCVAVTITGTTKILFEFDAGSSANLALRPINSSGKAITWFKGYAYYGDFEYYRYVSDKLTVINVVDIEDYIKGILPYEMFSSWPLEALKAQAVCARSYTVAGLNGYSAYGFDLTADTYSQAYLGTNLATTSTDAAVDATAGEYATYNGKICSTYYFSSDGGATENSENIFWTALPYLRGVVDPFEADVPQSLNGNKSWRYEWTGAVLKQKLSGSRGYKGGDIVSVVPQYSEMGNVIKITLSDVNGVSITLTKDSCYSALGLKSVRYNVTPPADASGVFLFEGSGYGHNVGMSQFGAYSMAKNYGLNYRQIIRFYYTGVNISKGIMA